MLERKLITIRLSPHDMPTERGEVIGVNINYQRAPALLEHLGADRRVVSHTLTPLPDGDYLLSLFVEPRDLGAALRDD